MNRAVKLLGEHALLATGAARIARLLRRGNVAILAYHNIVADGHSVVGERSLHLPLADFERQVELLTRTHHITSLADALGGLTASKTRPQAVLTFDDAYAGALRHGLGHLRSRGLPATVFVSPALLGGRTFWWDALAPGTSGSVPHALRERCLSEWGGSQDAILAWAREMGMRIEAMPEDQCSASEDELLEAIGSGPFTVGSHSWAHANLAVASEETLESELAWPKAWLLERFGGRYVDCLAYPYGLASPSAAHRAAAEYRDRLLLGGRLWRGTHSSQPDVPRVNVPASLSIRGLELRASGVVEWE